MKTLLALAAAVAVMALGSLSPAAAKTVDSAPLRCLVLDSTNQSRIIDVCRCLVVSVSHETKQLLRPNPSRVASLCPGGGGAASFASSEEPSSPSGHGFSFSKAESSSSLVGVAVGGWSPLALSIQQQDNSSVAAGDGGASAVAGSTGISLGSGSSGSTWGSTGGGSCAGEGC